MDLSIIIINWRSCDYLKRCLTSIYSNPPSVEFEVLVVDNASFDGSEQMVARECPQVKFFQSPTNLGFAGANNTAANMVSGDFLLFLNPDTEVRGDALDVLTRCLVDLRNPGAVGARLLNGDDTLQTSCIQSFPTLLNQVLDSQLLRQILPNSPLWGTRPLFSNSREPMMVDVISGACLMIKRETFVALGGFSEEYFMYSDDVDLCYRLHRRGFQNWFAPKACVIHYGGCSSQNQAQSHFSTVLMRESRARYFRAHRGRWCQAMYRASMALAALIRLFLLALRLLLLRGGRGTGAGAALLKWKSVLQWAVGFEKWSSQPAPGLMRGDIASRNKGGHEVFADGIDSVLVPRDEHKAIDLHSGR